MKHLLPYRITEVHSRIEGGETAHEPPHHPALLIMEEVSVVFNGFKALDIKSFYVDRKELRFLIGPNGAGKTTLLDAVCRKVKPKTGRVIFDGTVDLLDLAIPQVARLGISRKFQAPSVFPTLTVWQNMELAYPRARGVFQGLGFRLGPEERDRISELLGLINLSDRKTDRAVELSHGQKQWLEIGLTLLQEPKLLLVDEPVAGMTQAERMKTGELLSKVAEDRAVLVVEHDMHFVRAFSTTISVLHEGRLLCEGNFDQVSAHPEVIDVYLGRGNKN